MPTDLFCQLKILILPPRRQAQVHDVFFSAFVVVHCRSPERNDFIFAKGTHNLSGVAEDQRVVRNFFVLRDDGARADNAVVANLGVAQNYRTHTNKAVVADFAAVNNRVVPDGDIVADFGRRVAHNVNRAVVLNVGVVADSHRLKVSANRRAKPNTRTRADFNFPDNRRAGRNKYGLCNLRLLARLRQNYRFHFTNPSNEF